jgi:hypothetical protein
MLEDLADPKWIAAYEAAGGHVRRGRSASGAAQAMLVGPMVQPLSTPTPTVLRVLQNQAVQAVDPVAAKPVVTEGLKKIEALRSSSDAVVTPAPEPPVEPRPSEEPRGDEVFSGLRQRAIAWLGMFRPKTRACMDAAHDAIRRRDAESLAHAATSLRRALTDLADYVELPGPGTRPDHTGEERKVGREQFRNRLYIYLGKKLESSHQRKLALAELDLIEHQLVALTDALGQAVHADSIEPQLEQVYITTWSVISQVVYCAESAA